MSALIVIISVLSAAPVAEADVMLAGSELHHQGWLMAQANVPAPMAAPATGVAKYDGWTAEQLRVELTRLENDKPSLALPIVLLSAGGVATLIGLWVLSVSLTAALIFILPGVGLIIWGVIVLTQRLAIRRQMNADIETLNSLLERPSNDFQPPLPPPPSVRGAMPSVLIASF